MIDRIKLFIFILLFIFFSGCAHHIVNGVEVTLPEPEQDFQRNRRY